MAPSRLRFSLLFPTKGFPSGAWAWSRRHAAAPAHPTACSLGGGNSTGPLAVATAAAAASYLPALPTRSAQPPASCCPAVRIPRLPGRPDAARRPAPPSLRAGPRRSSCAPPLRRGHRLRPRPRPAPPGRPDPSQERTQVLRLLCSTGCHGDSSARSGQVALGARQPSIHPRAGGPSTWPHTQQKKSSKSSHQSSSHHEMALYVALRAQTLTANKVILLSCLRQTSGPGPGKVAGHRGGAKSPASRS